MNKYINTEDPWYTIGVYIDPKCEKANTVEDDIEYLKELSKQNKLTTNDINYINQLCLEGKAKQSDFYTFEQVPSTTSIIVNTQNKYTSIKQQLKPKNAQKKFNTIRDKFISTGFIDEKDFIEYNIKESSKIRALLDSMNIKTTDNVFFPVTGDPKSEYFKCPYLGFSWNKEDKRLNFNDVINGCKRTWTIEKSGKTIENCNIKKLNNKGTFGFNPPEGYVILDIDNMSDAIVIKDYIFKNDIKCNIIQTNHGIHFIFKYNEDGSIKNNAKKPINLYTSILADYRTHNGYIVLPHNIEGRKYLRICKELDEIPNQFKPFIKKEYKDDKNYVNIQFEESFEEIPFDFENIEFDEKWYTTQGSRDNTLYAYLCGKINDKKMWYYPNFERIALEFNIQCLSPRFNESEVKSKARRIFDDVKNSRKKVKEAEEEEFICIKKENK